MKEYEYEVIGLLLKKVNTETGESVLNRHGDTKLYKHLDDTLNQDYMGIPEESAEVIPQ